MSNNTVVCARINSDVKTEAMEVLEAMGLTIPVLLLSPENGSRYATPRFQFRE